VGQVGRRRAAETGRGVHAGTGVGKVRGKGVRVMEYQEAVEQSARAAKMAMEGELRDVAMALSCHFREATKFSDGWRRRRYWKRGCGAR